MTTKQNPEEDVKHLLPFLLKLLAIITPILLGIGAQIIYFLDISCINVIIDPPGEICPWVSLEWLWWIVILLGCLTFITLAYIERIPQRFMYPIYIYTIFLLILIKPV